MSCSRTTKAAILGEAWPINSAQNKLQMLCGHCSLPMLHFLDNASAAKGVASVNSLVLHAPIHFLRPIDFPAIGKRNMRAVWDRLWAFAFKGENVGQRKFYTRVGHGRHRSPPRGNISCRAATYSTSWSCFLRERAHARATVEQFFGEGEFPAPDSPNEGVA